MKKASEYRKHAEECRELAAKTELGDQREQLLRMAAHWDQLAKDRSDLVQKHPELATKGERAEEHRQSNAPSAQTPKA
jgi:hypothetical protein